MPMPHLLDDPYLKPYEAEIRRRAERAQAAAAALAAAPGSLAAFACAHEYYGLHPRGAEWVFRECAPGATSLSLAGDFNGWDECDPRFALHRLPDGKTWECRVPRSAIRHGQRYHLMMRWSNGQGERIPAYARRVVQDTSTGLFEAQVWDPPVQYAWHDAAWRNTASAPLIYEAHIGMAQEAERVATYDEFRRLTLPRVAAAGYNTLQLMAVMEHPYYASFGYHVGSFFAASSRFGTPEELKALVDDAHALGIAVVMDIVHSHAVRNERDGLSLFDGTPSLYFHDGPRGWHQAWDSRCFDYGKTETLHFLLSNLRYWLDEFHFDGFRFDGVTSMLYLHHGLGVAFTDYSQYFGPQVDADAWTYLNLANRLVHEVNPGAITIAEDVSGMPGLAAPVADCGAGFDFRMAMGVTECWFELATRTRDEDWSIGALWHELTNRRAEEKTVSYVECHDQALVGGKTFLFGMLDAAIYDSMHRGVRNLATDRAVALHKLARLATLATAGGGYLNFMGNEFGHPEWIDFPREGNGFSYAHARRLWHLRDDPALLFKALGDFDAAIVRLASPGFLGAPPRLLAIDEGRKFLAFERHDLLFLFNFHPVEALADFPVVAPPRPLWRWVLDSDRVEFGGLGRIRKGQEYPAPVELAGREAVRRLRVYLPPRTALVCKAERATRARPAIPKALTGRRGVSP